MYLFMVVVSNIILLHVFSVKPKETKKGFKKSEKVKTTCTPLKGRRCSSYLLGVKRRFLVSLRVLSLERFTARAFAVPFRVLNRKNMTGDKVLFQN